ncbi:unnamed protein product [Arctogadus glacialis]
MQSGSDTCSDTALQFLHWRTVDSEVGAGSRSREPWLIQYICTEGHPENCPGCPAVGGGLGRLMHLTVDHATVTMHS